MIAAPLVLSACSSGNSGNTSSSTRSIAVPDAAKQGAAGSGSANLSAGSASQPKSTSAPLAQPSRSLIITAGLQVKTDDAAAAAARAQIVVQGAGGFVAEESIGSGTQQTPTTSQGSSSGGADTGTLPNPVVLPDVTGASQTTQALLVLRVPPAQLDAVLSALAGKGSVTYQSRTATDVTGQVADVASRVTSAQAAITELRALIDKAASMNDLISLEQALSQRESDLESLQAQSKALADQVQYATITVGYYSQGAPAPAPAVHTGFMRGLTVGWHAFTRTVRGVLVVLGWLVPFAVLAALLWWPVRWLVRRNRARGHGAPAAAILAPAGLPSPEVPASAVTTASEPPVSSPPDE
jgi:hypothetical protein